MRLILLSLLAWLVLSVPVALFIGRLCGFSAGAHEERGDSQPVEASPTVRAEHLPPLSVHAG